MFSVPEQNDGWIMNKDTHLGIILLIEYLYHPWNFKCILNRLFLTIIQDCILSRKYTTTKEIRQKHEA